MPRPPNLTLMMPCPQATTDDVTYTASPGGTEFRAYPSTWGGAGLAGAGSSSSPELDTSWGGEVGVADKRLVTQLCLGQTNWGEPEQAS